MAWSTGGWEGRRSTGVREEETSVSRTNSSWNGGEKAVVGMVGGYYWNPHETRDLGENQRRRLEVKNGEKGPG